MKLDVAVAKALERYMPRVQVRGGNGLSRAMNQSLRSYEQIPLIISRTVEFLAGMEALFDFGGAVRLHYQDIYRSLMDTHDDWVREVPRLGNRSHHQVFAEMLMQALETGEIPDPPPGKGTIEFVRVPQIPLHQFSAAWTIARRIGVIQGRGEVGLSRTFLTELRKLLAEASQSIS